MMNISISILDKYRTFSGTCLQDAKKRLKRQKRAAENAEIRNYFIEKLKKQENPAKGTSYFNNIDLPVPPYFLVQHSKSLLDRTVFMASNRNCQIKGATHGRYKQCHAFCLVESKSFVQSFVQSIKLSDI